MGALADMRAALATANHILAHEGVVDAFGHISARHPERPDRFLLSCSRSPALVSAEDIMEFDLSSNVIGSDARSPYLERFIHGAIYQTRPDVQAVVHSHAHELIPFGVTATPIRPLIHVAGAIGAKVPVWDIAENFGDTSLLVTNDAIGRDLAAKLGSNTVALMRGHGAVVTGSSVRNAVLTSIYLSVNASLDLQSRALGEVKYLSAGEIDKTVAALLGEAPAARAWEYFEKRCRSE
ncbi:class II aldolase/adducin family protein [Steroidobacter sp. S1-65]|uniref:Class II aldolase/adducin family protein n=2 Tax=Steroidobacter gossypii TaxID=2805490 RepID=A0ABS1WVC5_9GAMM|nr:class II aldolase/adducin family protein [Steroidobacter gossypii]